MTFRHPLEGMPLLAERREPNTVAKPILHKEIREILKPLEAQGYSYDHSNGGHPKLYSPTGAFVISFPSTPGGGRWKQNLLAELRRKDVDI